VSGEPVKQTVVLNYGIERCGNKKYILGIYKAKLKIEV